MKVADFPTLSGGAHPDEPIEDRYIFADAHRCDGWYGRVCASGEPDRPFVRLDWWHGDFSGQESFISIEAALVDFFHGGPCPDEGRHHDKPCNFSTTTLVPADWMNNTTAGAIGVLFEKHRDCIKNRPQEREPEGSVPVKERGA